LVLSWPLKNRDTDGKKLLATHRDAFTGGATASPASAVSCIHEQARVCPGVGLVTSPTYEEKDVLLRINNVGVRYGDNIVLSGVNAEVRDIVRPGCVTGQIVGILGPSGIGKTLFSRVITGLQKPTTGSVTVGPKEIPVEAGLVGYVAQNYPLLRHRTVLGNLMVAARRQGTPAKQVEERAMGYLKQFSLEDKWGQFPAELSGGQRQRVAIAQQLLCSEHYLILDEPTTGLDPIMKDRVCDFIRQVAGLSEENTILVVTHDIASILTIADHLWLLGRVRDEKGVSQGARILYTYDLIERGLAWQERCQDLPGYGEILKEVRSKFESL
jgi:ABC-type nitrate/sulfonate/bicarbonate transport system ATPase subunit